MKEVATREMVFAAADQLAASGADVNTRAVRDITGGSYTTIQKYLPEWFEAQKRVTTVPVPVELAARGAAMLQEFFSAATAQVQAAAEAEINAVREASNALLQAKDSAESEIARLEGVERDQVTFIEQLRQRVHDMELAQASAAAVATEHATLLREAQEQLASARQTISQRDQEVATLTAQLATVDILKDLRSDVARLSENLTAARPEAGADEASKR